VQQNMTFFLQQTQYQDKYFRYSFICLGTSTRKQQRDLFSLRVKLPPVTTNLTTQRKR